MSGSGRFPAAVPLREARGARDLALARALIEEYVSWLGVDLAFQGLAEELASLPGHYAPPAGRLLLAGPPDDAFGCIALRPLPVPEPDFDPPPAGFVSPVGEVKRLFVEPRGRRKGVGRALGVAIVDAARTIGYRTLCLDTLARMTEARSLYESLGFRPSPPYYENPIEDVVYYALSL